MVKDERGKEPFFLLYSFLPSRGCQVVFWRKMEAIKSREGSAKKGGKREMALEGEEEEDNYILHTKTFLAPRGTET